MQFLETMWRIVLDLAPWLLLGAVVAGILHVALPKNFVHRQLGGRLGVVKAVALGVPLPLCSCGVIPAGLGLKKDGASNGAAVGFLISTPQTGVDSILVSASFLGWPFALFKVVSATVTGLAGGFLTDALVTTSDEAPEAECSGTRETGSKLRAAVDHSLEILQTIWRWLVFGIVVSALIETFVPHDAFAGLASYGGLVAALAVLGIALPLYVCATASVPIAAALVAGGLPTGAALVFLMAGPATNLATIGAVKRALGGRALAIYLATIIAGSVGFALVFDFLLESAGTAATHSHESTGWITIGSAIVLVAMLAWFAIDDARNIIGKALARPDAARPMIELTVTGMTCGGCASRLERTLREAEGVTSATVTLEEKSARIQGSIDEARAKQLVEQAGFTVA